MTSYSCKWATAAAVVLSGRPRTTALEGRQKTSPRREHPHCTYGRWSQQRCWFGRHDGKPRDRISGGQELIVSSLHQVSAKKCLRLRIVARCSGTILSCLLGLSLVLKPQTENNQPQFFDLSLLVSPDLPSTWPAGFPYFQINHYLRLGPSNAYNTALPTMISSCPSRSMSSTTRALNQLAISAGDCSKIVRIPTELPVCRHH